MAGPKSKTFHHCLQKCFISVTYKNTTQDGNADGLSRLPLKKECKKEVADPVDVF